MKSALLAGVAGLVLFLGIGAPTCAQVASDDPGALSTPRQERLLSNLRYRIPQLREAAVTLTDLSPSPVEGMDEGAFIINGQQRYNFLVSSDDTHIYILNGPPIEILTTEAIETAMAEERRAEEQANNERHTMLTAFIEGMPVRGNPDAPITIVEFSDFQCPYCARAYPTVEHLLEKYPDEIRFVYVNYPLNNHPWAMPAAIASVCAANQSHDAFWELHDAYFDNQQAINVQNVMDLTRGYLASGSHPIDMETWTACASNSSTAEYQAANNLVQQSLAIGGANNLDGTPAFFINGRFLYGAQPLLAFEEVVMQILTSSEG